MKIKNQMRTMFLAMAALLCIATAQAQENGKDIPGPRHRSYLSLGTNYTPHNVLSYSAEAGIWGVSSNTTFGLTYDAVPTGVGSAVTSWVGIKSYYTVHSEEKLCYMVYVAPKVSTGSNRQECIEYGFNPYYTLSKDFLLGVAVGQQYYFNAPTVTFGSVGIVWLLNTVN